MKKKKPKAASQLFEGIIKASVKGNPTPKSNKKKLKMTGAITFPQLFIPKNEDCFWGADKCDKYKDSFTWVNPSSITNMFLVLKAQHIDGLYSYIEIREDTKSIIPVHNAKKLPKCK